MTRGKGFKCLKGMSEDERKARRKEQVKLNGEKQRRKAGVQPRAPAKLRPITAAELRILADMEGHVERKAKAGYVLGKQHGYLNGF